MAKKTRPPIVAFLGHVDHGKTTLISKIKQKDLTLKEVGGISQHLGAYQVKHKKKTITIIDTPGHVAFAKMRSRGAKVADLIVLVVAADEGVKPQTLESLKYIKKTGVPYLVALNKIDSANVDLEQVKKDLVKKGIKIEGHGGDIVVAPVSAKTGKGVDQLLEMILLLAEMTEIKADPLGKLEAVAIESQLDSGRGPTVTLLIRNGQLAIGDKLIIEEVSAKIKAMFDQDGQSIKLTSPGQPVKVLGFEAVPSVGGQAKRLKMDSVLSKPVQPSPKEAKPVVAGDDKKIKIVLKADTKGTLEAILSSLPDEVILASSSVGQINQADVFMASATGAEIIGFNVKAQSVATQLAKTEEVSIKTYRIIYELLEGLEKRVLKILEPTIDEEILGQAEIVAEFMVRKERVAGAKVTVGQIGNQAKLHLKRGEKILVDTGVKSLRVGKNEVEEVKRGKMFGVVLSGKVDFKVGDVLISYRPPVGGQARPQKE